MNFSFEDLTSFDDPGSKIKRFASVHFALSYVIGVIIAVIALITGVKTRSFALGAGLFLCAALVVLFGYIVSLFMAGFGELIAQSSSQTEILRQNKMMLEKLISERKEPHPENEQGGTSAATPARQKQVVPTVAQPRVYDGRIACPKCGKLQNAGRTECYNCGSSLIPEEQDKSVISHDRFITTCPNCGRRQSAERTECYNCGYKFTAEDTKQ